VERINTIALSVGVEDGAAEIEGERKHLVEDEEIDERTVRFASI
jgi:hypothetical protein